MSDMKKIMIDTTSVVATLHCNLNCKLCNTGVPFRKNPVRFTLDSLKDALGRYFSAVDYTRKLSFTGGEPFLRADFDELLEYAENFRKQFDILEVVTNGTIVPSEKVLGTLERFSDNLFILIDKYGDLSVNADDFSAELSAVNVKHTVRKYFGDDVYQNGWVDLTQFRKCNTPEQARQVFRKCAVPNKLKKVSGEYREIDNVGDALYGVYVVLINGTVYRCMRPFLALERQIDFDTIGQFVDIVDRNKSAAGIRRDIISMFALDCPSICEFCPGMCDDSERFIPAEQL